MFSGGHGGGVEGEGALFFLFFPCFLIDSGRCSIFMSSSRATRTPPVRQNCTLVQNCAHVATIQDCHHISTRIEKFMVRFLEALRS